MEIDEDVLKAALEVYDLEKVLDPDINAMKAAIVAALSMQEQVITERIAVMAEELSNHIVIEEVPSYEAAAALKIFATDLRDQIQKFGQDYEPVDDDIVEVVLSGEVTVYADECYTCGEPGFESSWSVRDRASGITFHFDIAETAGLKVRLISPGIDELIN